MPLLRYRTRSSRRWRRALVATAATVLGCLAAAAPGHAAKMFVVLADSGGTPNSGPVLRYDVAGPASTPTRETTITDATFDKPCCLAFSATGEMFVSNRSDDGASYFGGSITRFINPEGTFAQNGTITSEFFSQPHVAAFRRGELFVAQRGFNNLFVLRFLFDAAGNASFNGSINAGLNFAAPRGAAVSPSGELFISQCCGFDAINRYLFDADGNAIPNGAITGPQLSGPGDMAFSADGELFVANAFENNILRFTFDGAGNASPHGQISGPTLNGPAFLDFSPWGELFVGNLFAPGGVSRWTFDSSGTPSFNGSLSTPSAVADVQFGPRTPNQSPRCSTVTLDRRRLWPPNHRYVKVTATGATDPDPGDVATIVLDRITQDEPINGRGDGNTAPDGRLAAPPADYAWVRSERSRFGDGRVYRLHYTVTDTHAARCQGSATVSVPLHQGRAAIAPPYNSLHP